MSKGTITVNLEPFSIAVYDWIHAAINTGLQEDDANAIPIIRSEDNGTRPGDRTFVEYKIPTSLLKLGQKDELIFDSTADAFKLRGQREMLVSVNVIRDLKGATEDSEEPRPADVIAQLQQSLDLPEICDILRAAEMSVREENTITDASVFLETDYEDRQVMDVRFGISLEKVSTVSRIESVEVKNKLVDPLASNAWTFIVTKP